MGAFVAAVAFGFRHGFDWDHIAALGDLTGSQSSRRRSMVLATCYALGHAAMVLVLGVAAIGFAARLPTGVDAALERFVGATLVALGVYIAVRALTRPGQLPVRSRWMLVLSWGRRLGRWHPRGATVVVEHAHPHHHDRPDHAHHHLVDPGQPPPPGGRGAPVAVAHSHLHRHVAVMPGDPFLAYGTWSSFGVGMLHGIGAETPTQLVIFAAAANAGGIVTGIGLLVCFVAGILAANTVVAVTATYGFDLVSRRPSVVFVLSVLTAGLSLAVGALLLVGRASSLPDGLGG